MTGGGATIATTTFLVVGIARLVFGIAMRELVLTTRSALVRADVLAGEMGHRAKNILALAQVIVRQSAGSSRDVPQLLEIVDARFAALGRAQSVAEIHAGTPPIEELINDAVSPFGVARFSILGARVSVDRETAKNLGLLLHELCTNSMKYGALSLPSGNVAISWALHADFLVIDWKESGGPAVRMPNRVGFGSRLTKALFAGDGGGVSVDFNPAGLRCSVRIPLVRVIVVDL